MIQKPQSLKDETMTTTAPLRHTPQAGPPLPPVAIATTALFLVSLVLPAALAGESYPSPYAGSAAIIEYFRANPVPVLLTAFLQFGAAIPFAIFAATASVRLNRLGVRAPGATIALVGGLVASVMMMVSSFFTWGLSRPELYAHADLIRLLHDLAFIAGGPGAVVPLGLLVAGIAVPGLLVRLVPRWFAWAGLVIAGIAVLSTLAVAIPALSVLLPIARFPALAWIVAVAFLLPKQRAAANA
jgi:hypothetical protein